MGKRPNKLEGPRLGAALPLSVRRVQREGGTDGFSVGFVSGLTGAGFVSGLTRAGFVSGLTGAGFVSGVTGAAAFGVCRTGGSTRSGVIVARFSERVARGWGAGRSFGAVGFGAAGCRTAGGAANGFGTAGTAGFP